MILYQCITGRLPFDGSTEVALQAIAAHRFRRPRALFGDISPSFEAVVLTAMSARPGDRFSSVRGLGKALLEFAAPTVRAQWSDYFGGRKSATGSVVSAVVLETPARWQPSKDKGATQSNPSPGARRPWARPAVALAGVAVAGALTLGALFWLALWGRSPVALGRAAGLPTAATLAAKPPTSRSASPTTPAANQIAGSASPIDPHREPTAAAGKAPGGEIVAGVPSEATGRERPAPKQAAQKPDRQAGAGYGLAGQGTASEYPAAGE